MSSVDSIPDEQLQTRFCIGDTDESTDQDEKVNNYQKSRATRIYSVDPDDDTLTCRCIFDTIFQNECAVYAPLVDAIVWNDDSHRRNFDKFQDMLFSITLYNFRNREKVHGGIVSTLADYDRALEVYSGTAANNACNLNGKEIGIMKVIQHSPGRIITFTEIQEKTGVKETNLRYTMNGRNGSDGLLGKVKGLSKLEKMESLGTVDGTVRTSTKSTVYKYTGGLFEINSKLFQSADIIDRDKAERLTREFIEADYENATATHNSHTTLTPNVRDKNDNSIVYNNNNNNTIITDIGEREGSFCKNNGNIEKTFFKNIGIGLSGEICEDSSKSCQPTTKASLTPLTTVSTDAENKCERSLSDNSDDLSKLCQPPTITDSEVNVRPLTPNIEEKLTMSDLLRRDLKNYARSGYNSVVDNVPVFVGDFNKKYPGFVKSLGLQAVLSNAERLNERGWM